MNREEIIKSLQHTIDWMEQHGANGISVTQPTGCGGYKEVDTLCDKIALKEALKLIEEQKTGKWVGIEYDGYADGNPVYDVWECSNCHEEHEGDFDSLPNYCPECGAKMEAENESCN